MSQRENGSARMSVMDAGASISPRFQTAQTGQTQDIGWIITNPPQLTVEARNAPPLRTEAVRR